MTCSNENIPAFGLRISIVCVTWVTVLWSESLAESDPLRKRIANAITPEILERIAREHARGRRLYVGTTDLDTRRSVVWDMGAIAAGNDPHKLELFRTVLLASCSIPGLLPPVAIDIEVDNRPHTELHVDGGVSASVFVPPSALVAGPGKEGVKSSGVANVYVIVAGKMIPDSQPVERGLFTVSEGSLDVVLQTRLEGDLLKIYAMARCGGAGYGMTAVPADYPLTGNTMDLEPQALRRLFDEGVRFGSKSRNWTASPPGLKPGEWSQPRSGVRFIVAE